MSGVVLTTSLLFGGGAQRGLLSDLLPEMISLPLLFIVWRQGLGILREAPLPAAILGGVLLAPILQLIPLPPALWTLLPGRTTFVDMYAAAQITPPWLPISLNPGETWRSALSLLPAVSLFLAALTLDAGARRILAWTALAIGLLSVPIGLLQVQGGAPSPLYFFSVTNPGNAVGFFANRNHFAAFLFALIPIAAALSHGLGRSSLWAAGVMIVVLLLGLALTGSRTALLLGIVALAAAGYILRRPLTAVLQSRRTRLVVVASVIVVAPVILAAGLLGMFERLGTQGLADQYRPLVFGLTFDAARIYFPTGSGLGSFQRIYQLHEPPAAVFDHVVNHAHNDYLELLLELGAAALLLLAGWFVWLVMRSAAIAKGGDSDGDGRLESAIVVALWLLCIHSIWDYPLRTIALSSLLGMCCGFLSRAPAPAAAIDWEKWRAHWLRRDRPPRRRRKASAKPNPKPVSVS